MASIITAGTTTGTALSLTSDTSGELQIKTNNGSTTALTLTTGGAATFTAGTVSAPAITTTGDTNTGIFFPAADTIAFSEGGVESMRIDSSGNLGIGTASPACRLDLNRGSAGLLANFTDGVNTNFQIGTTSLLATIGPSAGSTAMAFKTGDTERMRIDSSGNVGIGTTTSSAGGLLTLNRAPTASFGSPILQVGGSSFTSGGYYSVGLGFTDATYTEPPAEIAYVSTSDSGGTKGAIVFGNRDVTTNTAVTERMRIDSSGNLLVGTTSSIGSFTAKLEILGGSGGGRPINTKVDVSTSANQISFNNTNGQVGSISTNGSATAYNTSSDYRLKENIAPMTGALATVSALKPVTYTWKIDGSDGQGFIAHELQAVVPDCVTGEKDAVDEEGNPQYQGIDTSFLVATLTAAIQEQQAMIEELKAEVAALKAA